MQSSKILTAGEGGILLCRTQDLADRAISVINCGRPHGSSEEVFTIGTNYRMTELQSALGNVALDRFPEQVEQRQEMAAYMDEALSDIPGVRVLPHDSRHTTRSFYRYMFAIDPDTFGAERDAIAYALNKEGISTETGYEPMHQYDLFQPGLTKLPVARAFPERFQFDQMSLPVAERIALNEAVWFDEAVFRAGRQGVDDAVAALRKIQANAATLDALK